MYYNPERKYNNDFELPKITKTIPLLLETSEDSLLGFKMAYRGAVRSFRYREIVLLISL